MIPKIIHQTVKQKPATWEENRISRRNRKLLPTWEHHLHDDHDNQNLIDKHYPAYAEKFRSISAGVMKADIARLAYLVVYGGFYLDTDYKLLRSLDESLLHFDCVLGLERGALNKISGHYEFSQDFKIGNAFFGARPNHPLFSGMLTRVLESVTSQKYFDLELMKISGPHGLTSFITENKQLLDGAFIGDSEVFFPDFAWKGLLPKRTSDTYGIHLCWGSWRSYRKLKDYKNKIRRLATAIA